MVIYVQKPLCQNRGRSGGQFGKRENFYFSKDYLRNYKARTGLAIRYARSFYHYPVFDE